MNIKPIRTDSRSVAVQIALSLACMAAAPLGAHEFWIEPVSFTPQTGETVGLRLFVGDGFERGRAYSRNPKHLRSFFVADGDREAPVPGRLGADPAGQIVVDTPGALIAAYESHPSEITLDAERFEAYLRDEGLEHVIDARRALGESTEPGREAFTRAAKTLLMVRDAASLAGEPSNFDGFDRRLDLAVEIVPLTHPQRLSGDTPFELLVLRNGEPLADAQVRVFRKNRPEATRQVRTDAAGHAVVPLESDDTFLFSVVHMERAPAGVWADWLSTWSSLTFTNQGSPPAVRGMAATNSTQEKAE